jgi:hypothetical protein
MDDKTSLAVGWWLSLPEPAARLLALQGLLGEDLRDTAWVLHGAMVRATVGAGPGRKVRRPSIPQGLPGGH